MASARVWKFAMCRSDEEVLGKGTRNQISKARWTAERGREFLGTGWKVKPGDNYEGQTNAA
jgi:hypothetical protein